MSTTAIVKFDDNQIDLIKKSIAVGASDNELKLFLYQCERTGLDPFAKQIYSIKRGGKMVTQVSIDGARLIAERSGRYAGQDGPYWCDDDGVWKDVWLLKKPPAAAKVNVYLMGVERGTPGVAHWAEYNQPNSDMWKRMPALMLGKCAEMLALRKAFPMELSGLYAVEEMNQVDDVGVIDVTPRLVDKSTGEILEQPAESVLDPKTLQRINILGTEYYTDAKWDDARHRQVARLTSGRTKSSRELTEAEGQKMIEGLEYLLSERRKKQAAAAEPVAEPVNEIAEPELAF